MKKRFFGFTLAEILITLGIIGVVASITIPIMMNNIQDAQFKTAYKKAYSIASQAWQKAYTDNLLASRSSYNGDPKNGANFDAFKSEFDIVQDCSSGNPYDCWSSDGLQWGQGTGTTYPTSAAHAFIDKSGMAWTEPNNTHCFIFVDINGANKPNQWGKDRFPFVTYINGIRDNTGIPDSMRLFQDQNANSSNGWCASSSPCYYTSWIIGSQ